MKKMYVIYDDTTMPRDAIRIITGDKSYGETIFKRVTLGDRMESELKKNKDVVEVVRLSGDTLKADLMAKLPYDEDATIAHLYSNFAVADTEAFSILLEKGKFMNQAYTAYCGDAPAITFLPGSKAYEAAYEALLRRDYEADAIENTAFLDLSVKASFLSFITGGFDARFFNALAGDEHTVTKRSTKKEKIKAEYEFYHLLPEDMKQWFVMPYDYQESEQGASYTMERYHMTDIAIRFVHGAVDAMELRDILEKLFFFINHRAVKEVEEARGKHEAEELYIEKVKARVEELKKYKEYEEFEQLLLMGTDYASIEEVTARYESLYNELAYANSKGSKKGVVCRGYKALAIGHGDLCFSNILYSRETDILKLIDPKGATTEEELYMDPYYDLAKLSHSICGCYDFFNSGLYDIRFDKDLRLHLSIDADVSVYKEIFKEFVEKSGFDYRLVRLYEASLFLSMLPYHMDQPGKVFGFLLNAIDILEEVTTCTKD